MRARQAGVKLKGPFAVETAPTGICFLRGAFATKDGPTTFPILWERHPRRERLVMLFGVQVDPTSSTIL